jgi:hypothetical protein
MLRSFNIKKKSLQMAILAMLFVNSCYIPKTLAVMTAEEFIKLLG